MPDDQLKLLIVDDYKDNRELLLQIFEDDYQTQTVDSGQACLTLLDEQEIDIVLLDVNMPHMDGYEVCHRLKQNPKTSMIPIIFVSALASTEERLKGYEVGAEDYVTKPFDADAIKDIVDRTMESRLQTKQLEVQKNEAMTAAFQAMTSSSEMGQIIQYLQASYSCHSAEQLAEATLNTLQSFGLNCCLLFRMRDQAPYFGCEETSIEAKVLERFHETERILDFGARTLINGQHVSLLVKNMPLDKPENYGRLKDNLIAMINGTESRCQAIEIEAMLKHERNQGIQSVLVKSQDRLKQIREIIGQQKTTTHDVFSTIHQKIESIIFGLGLEEPQEQAIIETIDQGVEELGRLIELSDDIEKSFQEFIRELHQLSH